MLNDMAIHTEKLPKDILKESKGNIWDKERYGGVKISKQ